MTGQKGKEEENHMEQILYYAPSGKGQEENLKRLSEGFGIRFIKIQASQTGQSLGFLAGVDGFEEKKESVLSMPPVLAEEMLIFGGISSERLDVFLGVLKTAGISISLKAILTPYNIGWSPAQLFAELEKERASFAG